MDGSEYVLLVFQETQAARALASVSIEGYIVRGIPPLIEQLVQSTFKLFAVHRSPLDHRTRSQLPHEFCAGSVDPRLDGAQGAAELPCDLFVA